MNKKLAIVLILSTSLLISRPPSLPNYGNTCYLNATLQSLYSVEPFVNLLHNKASLFKPNTFVGEYVELINQFTNPMGLKPGTPTPYLKSFAEKNDEVMQQVAACGIKAQNDSQEFLTKLIDELQNQDNFVTPKNQSALNFMTSIGDLFTSLQSRFQCPAISNLPSVNELQKGGEFSPIISIEIPQNNNPVMLEELLATFFIPEKLEIFRTYPQYSCIKQIELSSIPEIFIVHTKRLQFNLQTQQPFKITTSIDVPEILNLLPIINHNEEYQLTAVIVHQGGAGGGHYVAYVRDLTDKKWYYCSDSTITLQGDFSTIQEIQQGYMFFYQKIKQTNPVSQPTGPKPVITPVPTKPTVPQATTTPRPSPVPVPIPLKPQTTQLQKALGDLANGLNQLAMKINPSAKSGSWWNNIFWPATNP